MNRFRSIYHRATLSKHSVRRMRQRANLKNKKGQNKFRRNVMKNGICLKDIPRHPNFKSIYSYMKYMCKKAHSKSPFCMVYLYKDFIVPVSIDGVMITCFKVDERFNTIYDEIVEYRKINREYKEINSKYEQEETVSLD